MKIARNAVVMMMLAASVAACDDEDDPTGPTEADIAGTYSVQTFEYESDDDAGLSFDLATVPASQGGPWGITDMTVEADGSFAGELILPIDGEPRQFDVGGDIDITGENTMRIDFDATTDALGILDDFEDGTFVLQGNTLTLVLPDVTFDFPGEPAEKVEADLTIVGTRQ